MSRSHLLGVIGVRNQFFDGFYPKYGYLWLNMAIFHPKGSGKRVKMREWGTEKGPNQLFPSLYGPYNTKNSIEAQTFL